MCGVQGWCRFGEGCVGCKGGEGGVCVWGARLVRVVCVGGGGESETICIRFK